MMSEPVKGFLRIWMGGKSWPVWYYDEVPEGMRLARKTDLVMGRPVLYKVHLGPYIGMWGTEFVRISTLGVLMRLVEDNEVYVK